MKRFRSQCVDAARRSLVLGKCLCFCYPAPCQCSGLTSIAPQTDGPRTFL